MAPVRHTPRAVRRRTRPARHALRRRSLVEVIRRRLVVIIREHRARAALKPTKPHYVPIVQRRFPRLLGSVLGVLGVLTLGAVMQAGAPRVASTLKALPADTPNYEILTIAPPLGEPLPVDVPLVLPVAPKVDFTPQITRVAEVRTLPPVVPEINPVRVVEVAERAVERAKPRPEVRPAPPKPPRAEQPKPAPKPKPTRAERKEQVKQLFKKLRESRRDRDSDDDGDSGSSSGGSSSSSGSDGDSGGSDNDSSDSGSDSGGSEGDDGGDSGGSDSE